MDETRKVGAAAELRISRSLATASIHLSKSSKLHEIVTSLTGKVSFAFFDPRTLPRRASSRR